MNTENNTFEALHLELCNRFSEAMTDPWVVVNVAEQRLYLLSASQIIHCYPVSTSRYGTGSQQDSEKTPLGAHLVVDCIGDQQAPGTIFKARAATGELATISMSDCSTNLDLIITRILRLGGLEPGLNQGDGIDSYSRYIYIHGTHEEGLLGTPASHGCIRMASEDIIELYRQISSNTFVYIIES